MKISFVDLIKNSSAFKLLFKGLNEERLIFTSPLYGASKSIFVSELLKSVNNIVVLLPDEKAIDEFNVELCVLDKGKDVVVINELKPELLQEKITDITNRKNFILISTYKLLNCLLPEREKVSNSTTVIDLNQHLNYEDLIEYLHFLNYTKDKFVEIPGDYSVRGSIVDFWSYSEKNPVRIEFDGDIIDSIRYFDPESQRSIDKIEKATLSAALTSSVDEKEIYTDIISYLDNPVIFVSSFEMNNLGDEKINLFVNNIGTTLPKIVAAEVEDPADEFPDMLTVAEPAVNIKDSASADKFFSRVNTRWIIENEISDNEKQIRLDLTDAPSINSNYQILFNTIINYAETDYKIILASENELQSQRLNDLLLELKPELSSLIERGVVSVETLAIKNGFVDKVDKLLLLTDYQVFNKPYRSKISTSKKYKKVKSKHFASINKGDYVVHEDYGVGQYAGLETIKIGDVSHESMKLLYNNGGAVYVNLNYLALVKKYSSNESVKPNLSTLGSADWANTKAKTKKKIKDAARELILLYAKRKATKGYSFSGDTIWQKELEASFLYEDTPDQEKVTAQIKEDMETEIPMDRLVCGDVGFGKTEVAVRAAFKAVQDGKQVVVLVPTTILAEQHFNTFKDRFSQFPVNVRVLSRFQTKREQTEIIKKLETGNVDIVVGTHRLFSKDVKFHDLGLLVIDEEHRFGVMAKEKLRSIKSNVDTLTLTATPIPRTLNLSLLGARDLSIIATPPPNRQPIYTHVSVFEIIKIKAWILQELKRGGQVYVVHDRVQSIDRLGAYLLKYIPELKIAVAHGQMKPAQLENVIHGFLNKDYNVLLSTKIIESGIDIPNVNTIIVNRADRFGLAELHQLRGRVGRSNKQAYAYFIVPSLSGINKKSLRRLQAIEEFTDIGAGFNLSMRDLEIRGAGNLLGTEQSGFINDVGFDLYVKMITEAVEELKYQEFKEVFKSLPKPENRTEPTIDTYFDIGIPVNYVPEQMDRLNFYTALYSIKNIAELDELEEELRDRYGTLPLLVKRLMLSAYLKYYASYALFERIIFQRKNIFVLLPKGYKEDYYQTHFVELMRFVMDEYKDKIKFSQQKDSLKLVIGNTFAQPEKELQFLIKFSKEIIKLFGIELEDLKSASLAG
ncbi:MAG: transcription-repair coupling factor [Ignavibacteria bacterium CG2_30_36_16]|nr:MAG: transcription-repair coupling factor [Ignavibacteria bacterium CG2_30_36_16]